MPTTLAPAPRIVTRRGARDIEVVLRFDPAAPLDCTEVWIEDSASARRVPDLLDAVIERLTVYVRDYRTAMDEDAD